MPNEIKVVNGFVVGEHLGTPMQDATPAKPEDNEPYVAEKNTVTFCPPPEDVLEKQPEPMSGGVSSWNDLTDKPFSEEIIETVLVNNVTVKQYDEIILVTPTKLIIGETYRVRYDGTDYECTAFPGDRNATLIGYTDWDNPEYPFSIEGGGSDSWYFYLSPEDDANHTLSVAKVDKKINPLPQKFLPADYPYDARVKRSMSMTNDMETGEVTVVDSDGNTTVLTSDTMVMVQQFLRVGEPIPLEVLPTLVITGKIPGSNEVMTMPIIDMYEEAMEGDWITEAYAYFGMMIVVYDYTWLDESVTGGEPAEFTVPGLYLVGEVCAISPTLSWYEGKLQPLPAKFLPNEIYASERTYQREIPPVSVVFKDGNQDVDFPIINLKTGDQVLVGVNVTGEKSSSGYIYTGKGQQTFPATVDVGSSYVELMFDRIPLITQKMDAESATPTDIQYLESIKLNYYGNPTMRIYIQQVSTSWRYDNSMSMEIAMLIPTVGTAIDGVVLWSSDPGSTERFYLTVNDAGEITAMPFYD